MEISLKINDKCVKCGRCVRVCPAHILTQVDSHSAVEVNDLQTCIGCGHCAASCSVGGVEHSLFPSDKVHSIDYAALPTPQQTMLLCCARRSNRAFNGKPVPAELLDTIVEAAHRAPTASNQQQVAFTVVTDPAKLSQISEYTIDVFVNTLKKLKNPLLAPIIKMAMPGAMRYIPMFERMKSEYAAGNDMVLRGAKAVILIHTPKASMFGSIDCNLAYQNGSLMAESLGVSQFYTGFVISALSRDKKRALASILGIDGEIHAGMALGMPEFRLPNYVDRKDTVVAKL